MKIYSIKEPIERTARKLLVTWDDGSQETMGINDVVQDCDVVDSLSGGGRKVMAWREVVPRNKRPQIPPD